MLRVSYKSLSSDRRLQKWTLYNRDLSDKDYDNVDLLSAAMGPQEIVARSQQYQSVMPIFGSTG